MTNNNIFTLSVIFFLPSFFPSFLPSFLPSFFFSFRNDFRLTEVVKNDFLHSFHLASNNVNILYNHSTMIKTKKLTLGRYSKPRFRFYVFPLISFFYSRIQSQIPHCNQLLYFLRLLHLCQFSSLSLFFMTLLFQNSSDQLLVECFSTLLCLMFPHDYTEVTCIFGRNHRNDVVPCPIFSVAYQGGSGRGTGSYNVTMSLNY